MFVCLSADVGAAVWALVSPIEATGSGLINGEAGGKSALSVDETYVATVASSQVIQNKTLQSTVIDATVNTITNLVPADVGLPNVTDVKNLLNASTDPTVNEDSNDEYSVGSVIINNS